ncbi:Zn-ribbon domain-containing OB-fold protein [Acidobacteriota bacterium]
MEEMTELILNQDMFVQPLDPENPVLQGSRCGSCGKISFPKKTICPRCLSKENLEDVALSRQGELYSFSVAHVAPEGFKAPYAFGLVVLPEGLRLFSILQDCEPFEEVLKIGLPVKLGLGAIVKNEEGEDVFNYIFKPVSTER